METQGGRDYPSATSPSEETPSDPPSQATSQPPSRPSSRPNSRPESRSQPPSGPSSQPPSCPESPSQDKPSVSKKKKPRASKSQASLSHPETPSKDKPSVGKNKKQRTSKSKEPKPAKPSKTAHMRKNIRKLLKEHQMEAVTKAAQQEELERLRRLEQQRKDFTAPPVQEFPPPVEAVSGRPGDEAFQGQGLLEAAFLARQDVICLDSSDSSGEEEEEEEDAKPPAIPTIPPTIRDDVIELSSGDDDTLPISSDSANDDEGAGGTEESSGAHINDSLNQPDAQGRVLVGGIRFLYDNLVESLERYKGSSGFGCILAHSMGLGKTLQVISFIDILLRHTGAHTVLAIVPVNTLQNWLAEFNLWLPSQEALPPDSDPATVTGRTFRMYRLLSLKKSFVTGRKRKSKKPQGPKALARPGPDVVICDEGHRIKNYHASTSQALKNIRSRRRVVLTGYPLQNNLIEYWCMVDFVRPDFLGTRQEFSNMFERPILNGQCVDSTPQDARLMRYRSHVLHSLLEGFVQRRGHDVLRDQLPSKDEHVIMVRLSPLQRALYTEFMNRFREAGNSGWLGLNPLKAFCVCCKIWNHPDVLYETLQKENLANEQDLDLDDITAATNPRCPAPGAGLKANSRSNVTLPSLNPIQERANQVITYEWAKDIMSSYQTGVLENSAKMLLLFHLIDESVIRGDKILVFSQSLSTLTVIEDFLTRRLMPAGHVSPDNHGQNQTWVRNINYYRLDGSTSASERERLINQFNDPENTSTWAVCRVYRYGQKKPCHIYRLVCDFTLEKKIYDRQVSKQGMSDRVVDDLNPVLTFTRKESKLTKAEKRAAKKSYEDEKRASVPYSRPSYAHYYPTSDQTLTNIPAFNQRNWRPIARGDEKPVASVRPVQSTPIPMMPRMAGMGVAGSSSGVSFPVNYLQKAGVYVQRIVTTTGKLSRAVQGGTSTNRGSQVSLLRAIGNGCSSPAERQRLTPDSALWPSTPESPEILRELSRYAVTADTIAVGNELPSPSDTFTGDRGGGSRTQQHNQTTESDLSRQFRADIGMSISEALQRSKRKMAESHGHKQAGGKRSSSAAGFPGLSLGSSGLSFPPLNQALEGHMSHPLLMGGSSSSPFLQSAGQTLGDLQAMFPSAGADLLSHASSATGSNGHLPSSSLSPTSFSSSSTNTMPVSSTSTTLPPYLMNPSVADLLSPGFPLNYSQSLLPDPRMYPNTLGGGPASSGGSSSFLSHFPSSPSSLLGAALSRPDTHHMATENGGSSSDDDVIEVLDTWLMMTRVLRAGHSAARYQVYPPTTPVNHTEQMPRSRLTLPSSQGPALSQGVVEEGQSGKRLHPYNAHRPQAHQAVPRGEVGLVVQVLVVEDGCQAHSGTAGTEALQDPVDTPLGLVGKLLNGRAMWREEKHSLCHEEGELRGKRGINRRWGENGKKREGESGGGKME
ncbi:unnamed protein product, partial [Coregonus sp. 'balchen']